MISVMVHFPAGQNIHEAVSDALDVCRRLSVGVWGDFNHASVSCWPHETHDNVLARWRRAIDYIDSLIK